MNNSQSVGQLRKVYYKDFCISIKVTVDLCNSTNP